MSFFSVIINTTNRANSLKVLLHALAHQSYPHFEVIVVVGPTPDHTMEVLQPYLDPVHQLPYKRLRVLHCPKHNLAQSRNIGLAAAQGDIVAYIDDDAVPCYHWLAQLAKRFADPLLDGTGGIVYLVHPNAARVQHRIGIVSALAEQTDVRRSWLEQIIPVGTSSFWTARMMGTNMAFRRSALLSIGGFDEFYEWVYDDTDVALRLAAAGKLVQPVVQTAVYHVPASSQNRVAYTYVGRWWIQTKAAIYLTFKEGKRAGDTWQARVMRALHLIHGHWLDHRRLHNEGKIDTRQFFTMQGQEIKASLIGLSAGLFRPQKLLPASQRAASQQSLEPISLQAMQPFQNTTSVLQPAIDPVSGKQSTITIQEPPLRVCLLSNAYPPAQYEGVGRHTNLLAKGLFALGHHVHVITRGQSNKLSFYDGAYVHEIAGVNRRYTRFQRLPKLYHALNHSHEVHETLKTLVINDGIQVVHSPIWQVDGLVTAVSKLLPVVVWPQTALRQVGELQHNLDTDTRLVGDMEERLIKHAAHLVPCSQAFYQSTQQVYQIPAEEPYTIIPHGIEPVPDEAICPFDTANPPQQLTVLYVGRLEKRKGILELFQAMPQVLERFPNVRFIIAGSDNSQSDGFQQRTGLTYPLYFQKQYPQLFNEKHERVTFLGKVSEEELQTLYQCCDLFVAPSLYESFGFIYVEAMNYAKPVIGCQAGGIPEVVEDGVTGRLVEPGSGKALAEAILALLQSPSKLREMGLAGRQRLLDQFTHIQMARGYEKVYRQVISEYQRVL